MPRLVFCCVVLSLATTVPAPWAQPGEEDTGVTVVGITGRWWEILGCRKSAKQEVLQFASSFHEGSCAACNDGSLVLLKEETHKAVSFPCQSDTDPTIQSALPNEAKWIRHITVESKDPGIGTRLLAAIIPQPFIRYIAPVSRGLEPQLDEAVVPQMADQVDLSAAFRDMEPGVYRVQLEPIAEGRSAAGPVQVKWTEGGTASVSLPGLRPGLYKLEWFASSGQVGGPDAWVLVSGPQDSQKARAAFQEAADATQKWPDGVDARAPRAFLRGVLDGLSRQAQTR